MKKHLITGLALSLMPMAANAHAGHEMMGFWAGLLHPITGLDHLLVMLAVGFWAAQSHIHAAGVKTGGLFLTLLLAGVGLSVYLEPMALFESAIAMSLIVMALLVLLSARVDVIWQLATIAVFAVLHGVVHGQELLITNTALQSVLGMSLATTLIMSLGYLLGKSSNQLHSIANNLVAGVLSLTGLIFMFA